MPRVCFLLDKCLRLRVHSLRQWLFSTSQLAEQVAHPAAAETTQRSPLFAFDKCQRKKLNYALALNRSHRSECWPKCRSGHRLRES